jgi:hypothetical protein
VARKTIAKIDSQLESKRTLSASVADSFRPGDAVITLAGDMRISVDRLHKIHSVLLERLSKETIIRDYLPILYMKKVKNLLQNRIQENDETGLTRDRLHSSGNAVG